MMDLKVFTIFDAASETYLRPFFAKTTGEAERSLQNDLRKDEDLRINAHHYTLFELGEWNDCNAKMTLLDAPHPISSLTNYVDKKPELKEVG